MSGLEHATDWSLIPDIGPTTRPARQVSEIDKMPAQNRKISLHAPDLLCFSLALSRRAEKSRKSERTKIALQVAACAYLDDHPIRDMTVAALCKSAGVAHGTFYIYFSDRNALLADVLTQFVEHIQHCMRQVGPARPGDVVGAVTSVYFDIFDRNRGLMKCLVNHLEDYPETMLAFQSLNRVWLRGVVVSLRRRNIATHLDDAELLRRAYALGGMVDQYLAALFLNNDQTLAAVSRDRDEVIGTLTTLWKAGLEECTT